MNLQFFTAQLFCVRLFSSLQLWHCPTDSVRAHSEATTKPCPDHPPPVHTLLPRLAKNGRKRSSMPAYCCSSPHKIREVPTNAQKLVLTRTYYLFLVSLNIKKLGLCNGLFNSLSFLIPKLGGHVRLVCVCVMRCWQHCCHSSIGAFFIWIVVGSPNWLKPRATFFLKRITVRMITIFCGNSGLHQIRSPVQYFVGECLLNIYLSPINRIL